MGYLPVFLKLDDKPALVVGGGRVAAGKIRMLLDAGARVLAVSPDFLPDLLDLARERPRLSLTAREYRSGDTDAAALVFACTDDPEVQVRVAAEARASGILICRADEASDSDFSSGGIVRRGEVCVAVSTSGSSPALAAYLTRRLEQVVGSHYGEDAFALRRLRNEL